MSPWRMGSAKVTDISAQELRERTAALELALTRGGTELDAASSAKAGAIVQKVRERTSLTGDLTVVALAGATGSGKSSLFNALVGAAVSVVGARRPTTATPTAAVWGDGDASRLLDWLAVGARHHVDDGPPDRSRGRFRTPGSLAGLVLLDLPDFDSRELEHREEAERVLALVDVFVWVTDPQKYADARMHDDFLASLATHDAVTVVVLNQIDRLLPEQAAECAADLTRLLHADGLRDPFVISASAVTGAGLDVLRQRLADAVTGRNAARTRLAADVTASAAAVALGVAATEPDLTGSTRAALVDALARAAGIPTVVAAVERDYRHEAIGHTGWPVTRWARALRPRPLRRLRLEQTGEVSHADVLAVTGRSSLPSPTPAARAAVDLATRRVGDAAAAGLPVRWADAVHDAATPPGPDLADALDQAVVHTPLRDTPPRWWSLVNVAHLVLAVAAAAGLAWLVVLMVLGWLQLPEIETPRLGWFPLPLLLLVGGLVLGLLLAALSRWWGRVGARRRARRVQVRLRAAVAEVAQERIVAPVEGVLTRHEETRTALQRARG